MSASSARVSKASASVGRQSSRGTCSTNLIFRLPLGKAMIATKGYAAPEVGEAFNRARGLCEQLDRPPQLVSVLHGQWVHVFVAGDTARARRRAEELLTL